jgi:hypothetical protein
MRHDALGFRLAAQAEGTQREYSVTGQHFVRQLESQMTNAANIATALVALLHACFLVLKTLVRDTPRGRIGAGVAALTGRQPFRYSRARRCPR